MKIFSNMAGLLSGKVDNLPNLEPGTVISNALGVFYFTAGAAAVITIIVAGYYFVTGGGNPATVTKAKNAILSSVIGLIVIIVAFAITNFITGNFK